MIGLKGFLWNNCQCWSLGKVSSTSSKVSTLKLTVFSSLLVPKICFPPHLKLWVETLVLCREEGKSLVRARFLKYVWPFFNIMHENV